MVAGYGVAEQAGSVSVSERAEDVSVPDRAGNVLEREGHTWVFERPDIVPERPDVVSVSEGAGWQRSGRRGRRGQCPGRRGQQGRGGGSRRNRRLGHQSRRGRRGLRGWDEGAGLCRRTSEQRHRLGPQAEGPRAAGPRECHAAKVLRAESIHGSLLQDARRCYAHVRQGYLETQAWGCHSGHAGRCGVGSNARNRRRHQLVHSGGEDSSSGGSGRRRQGGPVHVDTPPGCRS